MTIILYSVIALGGLGVISALILYVVAQKFKVIEDPKIDEVAEALPGANCGGCGFAGCRNFAEAVVKAGNMDSLFCPVGGNDLAKAIGPILGIQVVEKDPMIAVVRCSGTRENAPAKVQYNGAATCFFAHNLYAGESGCPNGCLGLGDCVASCQFDAMFMDEKTGLPVIIGDKCVACGACVKSCPRKIIELRKKGKKDMRIFVSCVNIEKGAPAKKNCKVACIACNKCLKACPHEAITIVNNLSYINFEKCKLCRKCVAECPTGAIIELNFPPRKEKVAAEQTEKKSE